jgi:hypothetical protein
MKAFFTILLLLICLAITAQNKTLQGQFTGKNLDKSFINVINTSQYKATVSKLDGRFEIIAKVGDSILISSIQYTEIKFVVKPEFFKEKVEIPLKLKINELQQVDLYTMGLSGNIDEDVQNIKVNDEMVYFGDFDVSKVYDDEVTTASEFTFRNKALDESTVAGQIQGTDINFLLIFKKVSGLFRKKDKSNSSFKNKDNQTTRLTDKDFFTEVIGINENQIGHFISYAKLKGLTSDMLKKSNELDLIEFLMKTSVQFKKEYGAR